MRSREIKKRWERGAFALLMTLVLIQTTSGVAHAIAGPKWDQGLDKIYAYRPPFSMRHNVGLVNLMITNLGVIGNPGWTSGYALEYRGGEYLYAGSVWIGAIASDNLPYVSTGAYENELRPSLETVDHIYPSFEGATHGNRPGFSQQPDDDNDGKIDEDPLNGKDDDGDGLIDEDYSAVSQQMFACEYWDYTDEARARYPEHRPLHVKVHQESYAWSTQGANEFIGFDFKIQNDGLELLHKVYIGFFVDADIGPKDHQGYYTDDRGSYFGIDTTFTDPSITFTCNERVGGLLHECKVQKLKMDICSQWDVPDDGITAKGGDVPGYLGCLFLGHTTDPSGQRAPKKVKLVTARFFNGGNAYPAGDPANDAERYDLLSTGSKQTRPTGVPDDYRFCMSAGPFELPPGDVLTFQTAFVLGIGKDGMINNAINAQRVYNGVWRDVDGNVLTGRGGAETCMRALAAGEPLVWKDICDSLSPQTYIIKDTGPCSDFPNNMKDADCNCCTPLFSSNDQAATQGLETLVHWVGSVAPPPPLTNFDTGDTASAMLPVHDRKIVIKWDNLSELTADPLQRKILFTGYRVWRVEGWRRPVGSTGPAPDEWQLIADLSLRPADSLGVHSPFYLLRDSVYVHKVDSLVLVPTGSKYPEEAMRWRYAVGRYEYDDTLGLKNGMVYFYDVTAYSAWDTLMTGANGSFNQHIELSSRPAASEKDAVTPIWAPTASLGEIYVVPNPYVRGRNPDGWDLVPSNADPTGTKIAFVGLPREQDCEIKIYTLAGDLVRVLHHDTRKNEAAYGKGAAFWDLVSRNGQDIVSGIYLYSVQCGGKSKVGRFVVVR